MKKRLLILTFTSIILCNFTACSISSNSFKNLFNRQEAISGSNFYFDTVITITLYENNSEELINECFDMCAYYESILSNTVPTSDISKINSSPYIPIEVSDETIELINISLNYSELSDGDFSITVGNLCELWDYSSQNPIIPDEASISKALEGVGDEFIIVDHNNVTLLSDNTKLDLGGIAKGYIADKLKQYLLSQNVNAGIINLGGNVLCIGPKPNSKDGIYNIGLQEPFNDNGNIITAVKVMNQSVVTSGNYQRYFKDDTGHIYHHILDLKTGYPVDNDLNAVTIIADSSTYCDALSTITYIKGLEEGMKFIESLDNVEAVFIDTQNNIYYTSGVIY